MYNKFFSRLLRHLSCLAILCLLIPTVVSATEENVVSQERNLLLKFPIEYHPEKKPHRNAWNRTLTLNRFRQTIFLTGHRDRLCGQNPL